MNTTEMILQKIKEKNKIHANNLESFWNTCNEPFKELAENYLSSYCSYLSTQFQVNIEFVTDSYLMFVQDTFIEQMNFKRYNKYRYSTLKEAEINVYDNKKYMFSYMIGQAISQFFWKNHKEMFEFFKSTIEYVESMKYLEIGCGHGLYFLEAIKSHKFKTYKAVDISQTSIDMTLNILKHFFGNQPDNVLLENNDITSSNSEEEGIYDFITMGEVLEHVEEPKKLIQSVYKLLSKHGYAYISTCANCPIKDHIYLYSSINEIRMNLEECGFKIIKELIISNDNIPEQEWLSKKSNLSYAAILQKDLG